jgi:hypothetical protein
MNFGELKDYILSDTHRTDLTAEVAGFVRRAEGLIRRKLTGYELSDTLNEADRVAAGVYTLPSNVLQIRTIEGEYASREYTLTDVGLANIKSLPDSVTPQIYAIRSSGTVEFRGIPATDTEFTIYYFGHPAALSDDSDENDLLTDHEELYIAGAEHFLRLHTEDYELADQMLSRFMIAVEDLNEATARKIGGGATVGSLNLGNFRAGVGR